MTPYALLLAHHPVVEALPAVIPVAVLVGVFGAVVAGDRRRSRREAAQEKDRSGA